MPKKSVARKLMNQTAFVLACLVAALVMGGCWGTVIYQFDQMAGWTVGLSFAGFIFLFLMGMGRRSNSEEQHNRRFDD
jgi:hypothetical protein